MLKTYTSSNYNISSSCIIQTALPTKDAPTSSLLSLLRCEPLKNSSATTMNLNGTCKHNSTKITSSTTLRTTNKVSSVFKTNTWHRFSPNKCKLTSCVNSNRTSSTYSTTQHKDKSWARRHLNTCRTIETVAKSFRRPIMARLHRLYRCSNSDRLARRRRVELWGSSLCMGSELTYNGLEKKVTWKTTWWLRARLQIRNRRIQGCGD